MELKEFYKMQNDLDEYIVDKAFGAGNYLIDGHNDIAFLTDRILALMIEVGEFANATRCFKYWSNKDSESKERLLDEYADILHLFLSVGNTAKFTPEEVEEAYLKKYQVNINRQKEGY